MQLVTIGGTAQIPQPVPPVKQTVVVLGNVGPVSLGDSSRTVVALDTQQHALAFQDVGDYLRTDASVDIQQRAGAGVMADISVRGTSFEQTLVLLNGLRMNNAETSHFNLDVPVPFIAIGSLNILHGTGSTLYGSDAIGGVADFLTWKPAASTLRLRSGVGSFGENQQALLGSYVGNRGSEVVAGSRDLSGGFIPDRDYRTQGASSESRILTGLGTMGILIAGDDRAFGAGVLWQLQLLGADERMVRKRNAGVQLSPRSRCRLPPPLRRLPAPAGSAARLQKPAHRQQF
jgi:vitamin B12 transporter